MRKGKNYAAVIAAGYLMVIWISLKIAPFTSEGLLSVLQNMGIALNGHPFKFNICEETSNTVLVMTIVYLIAIVYFFATLKKALNTVIFFPPCNKECYDKKYY